VWRPGPHNTRSTRHTHTTHTNTTRERERERESVCDHHYLLLPCHNFVLRFALPLLCFFVLSACVEAATTPSLLSKEGGNVPACTSTGRA
jgi:hypothetical protein